MANQEDKTINELAAEILVQRHGLTFDLEQAQRIVKDVIEAQKMVRRMKLNAVLNKRFIIEHAGLMIEVLVVDVKVNELGTLFQVEPVTGSQRIWVKELLPLKK